MSPFRSVRKKPVILELLHFYCLTMGFLPISPLSRGAVLFLVPQSGAEKCLYSVCLGKDKNKNKKLKE